MAHGSLFSREIVKFDSFSVCCNTGTKIFPLDVFVMHTISRENKELWERPGLRCIRAAQMQPCAIEEIFQNGEPGWSLSKVCFHHMCFRCSQAKEPE